MIDTVKIASKMVTVPIPSWWYVLLWRIAVLLFMALKFKLLMKSRFAAIQIIIIG